ncbi:Pentatricopeptide repeat-containing protein, partial [Thalictrum thalictroides]
MGFSSYVHIGNALISMYSKCGNVVQALYIFERMKVKDIVTWNSMIAGYAQHGLADLALNMLKEMEKFEIKPDAITFLAVLSSCRHAGLVELGQLCFKFMVQHGLEPDLDHYSCIVDLLGRAGLVEEAKHFIDKMPIFPNAVIWGSLLSSCRLHGKVQIGIEAAENRL